MEEGYVISCCSTVDLSKEHLDGRNIPYVCFHYRMDESDYMDDLGQSMPFCTFYEKLKKGSNSVTSQVNVSEYLNFFEQFLSQGKDILHITLSSGISGTFNAASMAASVARERYPDRKIYIVDSLGASSGYGLFVDRLADLRDRGMTVDELRDYAEQNKLRVRHWFFSTDLSFYFKGGRISRTSAIFGTMLNICPLMDMDSAGKLIPREKIRGKKRVIKATFEKMLSQAENGTDYDGKCYISESDCMEDALQLAGMIEQAFPKLNGKVVINSIGTVIGSHTGPGTIALFYFSTEPRTL